MNYTELNETREVSHAAGLFLLIQRSEATYATCFHNYRVVSCHSILDETNACADDTARTVEPPLCVCTDDSLTCDFIKRCTEGLHMSLPAFRRHSAILHPVVSTDVSLRWTWTWYLFFLVSVPSCHRPYQRFFAHRSRAVAWHWARPWCNATNVLISLF
jgi:hypothetical protein